nr:exosortase F system-associated protein [Marinirhabdus gelatinilytica]
MLKFFLALLAFVLLVLVRLFEENLFYDPLLSFFKTDHTTEALPDLETGKLLLHTFFRYVINGVLSIFILWILFQKKGAVKFSIVLYSILFVSLFIVFFILLKSSQPGEHLALFYVRRFLIQPLLLLLLLPAFYVQRLNKSL